MGEIGPRHDSAGDVGAGARTGRAVAHHELRLAHGPERLVAIRPIRRHALDEDRGDDVVAPAQVGTQGRDVIGNDEARRPEVVVRVDDQQFEIDGVFLFSVLAVDLCQLHGPSSLARFRRRFRGRVARQVRR
jgi:hypothetical protein